MRTTLGSIGLMSCGAVFGFAVGIWTQHPWVKKPQPPAPVASASAPPVAPVRAEAIPVPQASASAPKLEVHFSPRGGCQESVVKFIGTAQKTIRLQAYDFTSAPISDALVEAVKRKIDVKVILDRGDESKAADKATLKKLLAGGVIVRLDRKHPIAHNKVIIVDGRDVETGSYNFTTKAEKNAENCLILYQSSVTLAYQTEWTKHWDHSDGLK